MPNTFTRPPLPYVPDPILPFYNRYSLTANQNQPINSDQLDGDCNYLIYAVNFTYDFAATIAAGNLPGSVIPTNVDKFPITDGAGNISWSKVTASYLAALSVSTAALQNGCVTNEKLGAGSVGNGNIVGGAIQNNNIEDDKISFDKIANVNNVHFQQFFGSQDDGTLNGGKISANSIQGTAIITGTLPAAALVTNSVTNTQLALVAQIPVGVTMGWAPGGAAPAGWLLASGQAVSRVTYVLLYTAIGTTFGIGDGATTFNLPDSRGRVTAGIDPTSVSPTGGRILNNTPVLGGTAGAETVILNITQIPSHTHTYDVTGTPVVSLAAGASYGVNTEILSPNTGSAGGGLAHDNMSPYILMPQIIYAGV